MPDGKENDEWEQRWPHNRWSQGETQRRVERVEYELDRKINKIEALVEVHESRHGNLNRMLLIVFITAVFNLGGVLLAGFVK